jgi:hypothetical protein
MSVEDAAPTVFSADNDAATALLHMRAQGVSVLMQLKPTGLPVILHWGADLGDLDGLTADALLAAFGPTGLDPIPSMMSSLLPEASLDGIRAPLWPDRMMAMRPPPPSPTAMPD